ncbi:MAG: HD domain-containing phosphohydrolase [Eubacteriales bacterium]
MKNRKIKIAAIDDNPDNLISLKALIKEAFPEAAVFTALTGQEGIELAVKEEPDVILLDIIMPGMDGFEVCTRLKADKKLCDIPVVFVTALKGDKENRIKAIECGAEAFLTKPIDDSELTAQIRAMLKIRDAYIQKRDENERLAALVEEKTRELQNSNTKTLQLLEAVKKEQSLIEAIFDSIPGYFYVYEESGRLIKWNKKHETMTGFTTEELSHMTLEKWFDQEDIIKVNAAVYNVFEKGYGEVEARLILKNGEKMMTRSSGAPFVLDGRKYFAGIGVDITEYKKIETQLQQNIDDLLESQQIAHLGTWRLNLATNQVVWSQELYNMYGFDPTIPPPPYTEHMKLFTPESWDKLSTSLEYTRTCGIPYELELETVIIDGSNGRMWVRGEAIRDSNGNITDLRGAAQDITERKKIEETLVHAHDLMSYIIEHNRSAVAVHDRDLKYLYVSQRYLDVYQIKEKDIIGKHHYDVFPDLPQKWRDVHQKALRGEISSAEKDIYIREDGTTEWTRWECRPWFEKDGSIGGIIVYTEVITKHIELLEELRKKEQNLRVAQEIAHVGSFDYDMANNKLMCSDEGLRICGITQREFSGEPNVILQCIHPDEREYVVDMIGRAMTEKKILEYNCLIIRRDNEARMVCIRVGPVMDDDGQPVGISGTCQDITERKKAESELLYLNYHDYLTGLYNRRFYEDELMRLDIKENLPISIIMCDINGLKLVNDSFGHDSGDVLLKKAAEVIKKACRERDIISRIGGDEFAVILPETDAEETIQIANRIKELSSKESVANIDLSISYGYDTKKTDKQTMSEVLANAENHMYRHKLYERSSLRNKTIDIIMNTLFEKSNRESLHSNRVSGICQAIASEMNFDKDNVNKIRIAGLIHDIGKIGIDEKILNKVGSLCDDEREQILKHPEIGWRILGSSNEFSELAQFVLNHHEKWDGSGYPNGLKGEKIPIEARIITVADSYDAMTSERTYKNAFNKDQAINELKRCSGTHFDPEIVHVFVNQVLTNNSGFGRGNSLIAAIDKEIMFGGKPS